MRLVSLRVDGRTHWGVVDASDVVVAPAGQGWAGSLRDLIGEGPDVLAEQTARLLDEGADRRPLADVELTAPIPRPGQNVMCLGLNYAAHAEESLRTKGSDLALPEHPVVFTKAVTSVTGPHSDVVLDPQVTTQADWEVELAVVIGRRARHVSRYDALSCVLGYTVVNDLSARDLQFRHKQFFVGKSVEGFCPMGPWIVTADEIDDPQNLDLWCRVNGVEKQAGNTQDQIFGIADTISRLSRSMTLEPGDIIATGTPDGVGFARQPPEFLAPGDVVECEVQGVGVIRNRMIAP